MCSREQTGTTVKAPHDYMMREVTVKEVGYTYVYISNENHSFVEVYFDDVKVTYTPTRVIQYNEYYPFGLQTSNSWTRDNHSNNYLYNQGSELNSTSGWYETMFRNYDPAIGRFTAIDPLATMYGSYSGYHYGLNNPVMMSDPSGAASCTCSGPPGNPWLPDFFNPTDYWAHMAWINSDAYATRQFYIQLYSEQGFNSYGGGYGGAYNNAPDAWNIMNNWVNGVPNSIATGVSSEVPVNAWATGHWEYSTDVDYTTENLNGSTWRGATVTTRARWVNVSSCTTVTIR